MVCITGILSAISFEIPRDISSSSPPTEKEVAIAFSALPATVQYSMVGIMMCCLWIHAWRVGQSSDDHSPTIVIGKVQTFTHLWRFKKQSALGKKFFLL